MSRVRTNYVCTCYVDACRAMHTNLRVPLFINKEHPSTSRYSLFIFHIRTRVNVNYPYSTIQYHCVERIRFLFNYALLERGKKQTRKSATMKFSSKVILFSLSLWWYSSSIISYTTIMRYHTGNVFVHPRWFVTITISSLTRHDISIQRRNLCMYHIRHHLQLTFLNITFRFVLRLVATTIIE